MAILSLTNLCVFGCKQCELHQIGSNYSRYKSIHIEVVHIALSSVIDQILGADA